MAPGQSQHLCFYLVWFVSSKSIHLADYHDIPVLLLFSNWQSIDPATLGIEFVGEDIVLFVPVVILLQAEASTDSHNLNTSASSSSEDQSPTLWCPQTWSWLSEFVWSSSLCLLTILTQVASRIVPGSCNETDRCWVSNKTITPTLSALL